jgi:hypothetical protein
LNFFSLIRKEIAMIDERTVKHIRTLTVTTLGVLLLVSGLALAQGVVLPLPPADQQKITAHLGSGVVGTALPSQTIQDVTTYFPLQARSMTYQVTSGPNTGNMQTLGVGEARRPNGQSAWRFQLSPSLAGFIHQAPGGDLLMPAIIDIGEGVVVITTPANPFLLRGMRPGETRSYTQQVSVVALDNPGDQEYSGTLNGTYTYVGTYQVTVPAGTYSAVMLRFSCDGKVGPAHTNDTAYYFFAPRAGVVAMISQEDATAFWIIHIDTSSGKVLATK